MKNWKKILAVAAPIILAIFVLSLAAPIRNLNPIKSLKLNREFKNLMEKAAEAEKANNLIEAIMYLEKLTQDLDRHKKLDQARLNLARLYRNNNQLLDAKAALQKIISQSNDGKLIQEAQKQLGDLNIEILFSPIITENSIVYEVMKGDSLSKIAKKFNTTVDLLMKSNRLRDDNIRLGSKLKVSTEKFSIFVDKSQNILILKANDEVLKTYIVSTGLGLDNITPAGTFKIVTKLVDPVWYKDGKVIPPNDPENILGSRWLGLSQAGYGIHGTTQPETIGEHVTRGCVRMYNQDVEELYVIVPLGTEVIIVE